MIQIIIKIKKIIKNNRHLRVWINYTHFGLNELYIF